MRIALVTTPTRPSSPVGNRARALLPHLRERAEVELFAAEASAGEAPLGDLRALSALRPRSFDQIVYALGNEPEHAFMVPLVRALGGTVWLHHWVLFDLAIASYPRLLQGGLRGHWLAWREGGASAWRSYRAQRRGAAEPGRAGARLALERARAELAWNHSIVRFADAFLVPSQTLREQILASRNAPTPIAVLPGPADGSAPEQDAAAVIAALERFPRARASRASLLALALRRGAAEARAGRRGGGASTGPG